MQTSLATATYCSFATFRKNGDKVATPVWFAELDGHYYIFSAGNAGKIKRLRNAKRSQMAVCNFSGKVQGEWHDTEAEIISNAEDVATARQALINKYGWQMRLTDLASTLGGKMNKRAYIRVSLVS